MFLELFGYGAADFVSNRWIDFHRELVSTLEPSPDVSKDSIQRYLLTRSRAERDAIAASGQRARDGSGETKHLMSCVSNVLRTWNLLREECSTYA